MLNIENLSYSIGQVAEITGVAQSTLRYWETVIDILTPHTTPGGSRRYSRSEIELISTIKDLLYNQGYTIKGANQFLTSQHKLPTNTSNPSIKKDDLNHKTSLADNKINISTASLIEELKKIKKILE